jgi:hypothetical protein
MNRIEHWENIYSSKQSTEVSWFAPHLESSLTLIDSADLSLDSPIVDIGGGASTLVDDLLERGYTNISVLDISQTALDEAKERLGDRAGHVR